MAGWVKIETTRFGRIEATEDDLIHFPGLPGFPQARRFVVRTHDRGSVFGWLICIDEPELAFVVTDPLQFFPDYAPEVDERQLRGLGVATLAELEVLVIASVRDDQVTLNLAAPVLINSRTRQAEQVILERGEHSSRQPLPSPEPHSGSKPRPGPTGPVERA